MLIARVIGRTKTMLKLVRGEPFDVFDLLVAEHMRIERIAIELRLVRDSERRQMLLGALVAELDRHMAREESVVYPACAEFTELDEVVDRAHADHQLAKNALMDLQQMSPGTEGFTRLVTTLIIAFERHLQREEGLLFAKARRLMTKQAIAELRELLERTAMKTETPARPTARREEARP